VPAILEITDVCKTYGNTMAADHINLTIPEGSIYGILGPNGAGKTTLIRMITTITRPDSGQILYKGKPLVGDDAAHMGYMPEERGLYKKMTVLDQLLFFAEIKGLKGSAAKDNAHYWMKRLQIQDWAGKKLEELSKGMAQKVQLLCTIMHKPELIILDEPFSGFDPINADLVKDIIVELNRNGATILFSTHRMDNVEELCSHLAIIGKGKKVLDGESGGLRRRMFQNQYELGYLAEVDFSDSPYAQSSKTQTSDGRFIYRFDLTAEESVSNLLQFGLQKGNFIHFTEALPTIHQIFVNTIKNQENE
jgi:ABC-2 type transport system ATP-binding protein